MAPGAAAAGAAASRRARGSALAAAATAKTPPASTAIAGPGGAFSSTDSHSPAIPSTATRTTVAICHGGIRCVHSLVVAAGTTSSAAGEGARRGEDRHGPQRDQGQEDQIRKDSGYAERPGALGVESRRQPTAAEQQVRRQNNHAESAGEDQVARLQHEQAPEQERLDVRPRMKDVGSQDHAQRQRPHQRQSRPAVVELRRRAPSRPTTTANANPTPSAPI